MIKIIKKSLDRYNEWANQPLPPDLQHTMGEIKNSDDEILDRFCKDLTFGTSGMRGKMGVGTNRINEIVVTKATLGVCEYLLERYDEPKLVIAYDTRNNSKKYAEKICEVLTDKGIMVYIFDQPTPVPVLSFAIRDLQINGGIMITASHNTKEYNGYKVYDHYGNQIDDKKALTLQKYIEIQNPFNYLKNPKKAEWECVPEKVIDNYLSALKQNILYWDSEDRCKEALKTLKLCYTPLNGTGRPYVLTALEELGIDTQNILEVKSQAIPDGNFPTCPSPNPEYDEAFTEAIKTCEKIPTNDRPDIIIATDPDSDRLGVMSLENGKYCKLTGNEVGELMLDYIIRAYISSGNSKNLQDSKIIYKSFVTSPLAEEIAKRYNIKVKNVFTGFKNIAFEIEKLNKQGRADDFLFGFEESIGYLYGNYTRDKDGIMASQMIALLTAELKKEGKTLLSRLNEIYEEYGYVHYISFSIYYDKEIDRAKIKQKMDWLFDGKLKFCECEGIYIKKETCYHEENMYVADLNMGHRLIIRPSGTELKLKTYIFSKGESKENAIDNANKIFAWIKEILNKDTL